MYIERWCGAFSGLFIADFVPFYKVKLLGFVHVLVLLCYCFQFFFFWFSPRTDGCPWLVLFKKKKKKKWKERQARPLAALLPKAPVLLLFCFLFSFSFLLFVSPTAMISVTASFLIHGLHFFRTDQLSSIRVTDPCMVLAASVTPKPALTESRRLKVGASAFKAHPCIHPSIRPSFLVGRPGSPLSHPGDPSLLPSSSILSLGDSGCLKKKREDKGSTQQSALFSRQTHVAN